MQLYDNELTGRLDMLKIRAFDIFLTAAALAALIFLLPADRNGFNQDSLKIQANVSLLK
jgi:hypothetical protein